MNDDTLPFEDQTAPVERKVQPPPHHYLCWNRILTAAEEIDLCTRAKAGDQKARQDMMEANIRLVMAIARRYNCRTMTSEDVIQEGIVGLLDAIQKFDVTRGYRFSTYATYWIKQSIVRSIEKTDRIIRLPAYGCNAEKKVRQAEKAMYEKLGRLPTVEEIVKETRLSRSMVQALICSSSEPLSLDAMFGEEGDNSHYDQVANTKAVDPQNSFMQRVGIESLAELLKVLNPRERAIVECRYGLRDGRCWTLKECADVFHLSREGVRHNQARALKKLRQAAMELLPVDSDLHHAIEFLSNP